MLCVLKRTVSMRWFFWAPKTYVKTDGLENIYNFTLKNFVDLNLSIYNFLIGWSISMYRLNMHSYLEA